MPRPSVEVPQKQPYNEGISVCNNSVAGHTLAKAASDFPDGGMAGVSFVTALPIKERVE